MLRVGFLAQGIDTLHNNFIDRVETAEPDFFLHQALGFRFEFHRHTLKFISFDESLAAEAEDEVKRIRGRFPRTRSFVVIDDAEQKLGGSAEAPPHKALNCRLTPAAIVRIENLAKIYRSGDKDLVIFHDLALQVETAEQVAIIGESGAGKSTLLHLISGLDKPSAGAIYYKNRNIIGLPEPELSDFRNREIGYVWQQHHLLPEFSAEENVSMPLRIRGESGAKSSAEARASLEEVGLGNRANHRAGELSGGEQQRIAVARALTANPSLLLADEPTGNLDEATGRMIFSLLDEIRKRRNLTTILVTHNLQFARRCDRVLKLEGGALQEL